MTVLTVAGTGRGSVVDALRPGADLLKLMVVTSVYTWARDSDLKKYGWWASALATDEEGSFGSLLWKLARAKETTDLSARLVAVVEASLGWLKRREIADDVYVQTWKDSEGRRYLRVTVRRGDKDASVVFDDLWKGVR